MTITDRRAQKAAAEQSTKQEIAEQRDLDFWKGHQLRKAEADAKTTRLRALRLAKIEKDRAEASRIKLPDNSGT